jgi:hypothetical protein
MGLEDSTKFVNSGKTPISDFSLPFLKNLATFDDNIYDQAQN